MLDKTFKLMIWICLLSCIIALSSIIYITLDIFNSELSRATVIDAIQYSLLPLGGIILSAIILKGFSKKNLFKFIATCLCFAILVPLAYFAVSSFLS